MSNDNAIVRAFKLWAKVSMMVVDGSRDARSVADALQAILENKLLRLTALESFTIASNTVNPHDFFKTRAGLLTSIYFNSFILSCVSKKNLSSDEVNIGYTDLVQDASDAEIGAELPEGYVFEDVNVFITHLATLIEGQWGGEEGILINNGHANIFYVKVRVGVSSVRVDWSVGDRLWQCRALRLDDIRWRAGSRVFSATTAKN